MNLVFSMNKPSNTKFITYKNNENSGLEFNKNQPLQTSVSTYIKNLNPYDKNINNNYFINQNNNVNMLGINNNYYKNKSSMFQINNVYTKNCTTCGK